MEDLAAALPSLLTTEALGRTLHVHESLGSTNDEALRLAREGAPHGTVVIAERQTAGRGRRGRSWASPAGRSLYLSVLLRPALPPQRAPEIVPVVAVAGAEALRAAGVEASIKWPNDLVAGARKIAGILTELSASMERIHFVVVGIGINVNLVEDDLPEELRPIATSVRTELGREVSRADLAADFLARFESWLGRHERGGFEPVRERYRALSSTLGTRVRLIEAESEIEGIAEDIDEAGALLLRRDDGVLEQARTGDVTSLRPAR
ncbi:biotin--[acetyl-CoA-carboxylase] ligase [Vulgatibacter sp.]|uniref:biotin--[acetyl-CoA-carboxylase] ligase n=1 Tax=Vulgatibacter sp. TaxID=1971226 RepID=UPI00356AFB04